MQKIQSSFEGYNIAFITKPTPESIEGYKHCIVVVDCFSKWGEIYPIMIKATVTRVNCL